MTLRKQSILFNPAGPNYPVVHLEHLMIPNPTGQSVTRPDYPVIMHVHDLECQCMPPQPAAIALIRDVGLCGGNWKNSYTDNT